MRAAFVPLDVALWCVCPACARLERPQRPRPTALKSTIAGRFLTQREGNGSREAQKHGRRA
jgi:hypothetical protein